MKKNILVYLLSAFMIIVSRQYIDANVIGYGYDNCTGYDSVINPISIHIPDSTGIIYLDAQNSNITRPKGITRSSVNAIIDKTKQVGQIPIKSTVSPTGNLLSKWEPDNDIGDDFDYDSLNRLAGSSSNRVQYDSRGNIVRLSELGEFTYDNPSKPYAISGATLFTPMIPPPLQQITYTAQGRPSSIAQERYSAAFTYNGINDRVKMSITKDGANELTRYYFGGCYELDVTPSGCKEKLYLTGDYYSADIVLVQKGDQRTPYAIVRDELGSIMHVTGGAGSVAQDVRYDAWGTLRESDSYTICSPEVTPELFLGRGYTGHEHLTQFGLINMNARLYDPMLGRFLSPDPYVQMPDFTQSFNRYAYCMNNPMAYVDKDGEFALGPLLVIAFGGGIINCAFHANEISSATGSRSFLTFLKYFGIGTAATAAGTVVGMYVGTACTGTLAAHSVGLTAGFLPSAAQGATTGFVSGLIGETCNSLVVGDDIETAFLCGLKSGAVMGGIGTIVGGLWGGLDAINNGKNWWTGRYTTEGAIQRAANAAEESIGGSGHAAGSQKHKYAADMMKKYQGTYKPEGFNLQIEQNYWDEEAKRILRPDIWDMNNNIIYDYKFGYPNMTLEQLNKTKQMINYRNFFKTDNSVIIKPQCR